MNWNKDNRDSIKMCRNYSENFSKGQYIIYFTTLLRIIQLSESNILNHNFTSVCIIFNTYINQAINLLEE